MASEEKDFTTLDEILEYQSMVVTDMFQFQESLVKACISNANDWRAVADGFAQQHRRCLKMAEVAAWIGRKSADNLGDIITAQHSLDADDDAYDFDDDDTLDDDDED